MRVLNVNVHFFPETIGGAAVVAEKFAYGLVRSGHDVTNVYLSAKSGSQDFEVSETPFGRSIGLKNVSRRPDHRFSNPAASSLLSEIIDIVKPERIFLHAVQFMGIQELFKDPSLIEKTVIVAHDSYWSCLQGFRRLPDGSDCNLRSGSENCAKCAWFPGLIEDTYTTNERLLANCRGVVFPSEFLKELYIKYSNFDSSNFLVQSNPDLVEDVAVTENALPKSIALRERFPKKTIYGFMGGPGETKGWSLVQGFMELAKEEADSETGPSVVLFDIGEIIENPWYNHETTKPGTHVAPPYHWTYAKRSLEDLDFVLMPSTVRESFGLAAREALSMEKGCVIRPSGALAELVGKKGVFVADEGESARQLAKRVAVPDSKEDRYLPTSVSHYADVLMSI